MRIYSEHIPQHGICEERMFMTCNLPGDCKTRENLLDRVVSALLGPLLSLCDLTAFEGFHSGFTDVVLALICVCVCVAL